MNMKIVFGAILFLLSFTILIPYSFALEETGNVNLLLKYENGNKADINSTILKIYQDLDQNIFKEIIVQDNPISITNLPLNHKYKMEVYYNDHFQSVDYFDLTKAHSDFEMTIKLPGGVKFEALYNDGQTPIKNAEVYFKTMKGKIVGYDKTDFNGDTIRFWLPQTIDNEFYTIEILVDPALKFTYAPLKITDSLSKDIKIKTNWPKIIDSAITVEVYKDEKTKVTKSDGDFIIQVNDKKKKKIIESPVSFRGEATISNIPIGAYAFHVISKDSNEIIASKKIILSGNHEPIKIFTNDQRLNFDTIFCNCVAFRLDDVQDYFLSNSQIQMMKTFEEMDAGLTVGIIGSATGKDPRITDAIKEQLQANPRFEVANHSWNNRIMTSLSIEEQEKYIEDTNKVIQELFQVKANVFIPPENIFDNSTITSLKKLNYNILSASTDTDIPPKFVKSDFYHFDTSVSTARLDAKTGYWNQLSKESIIEGVNDSLFDYGYAVVMMHPYEFSNYHGIYVNEVNQTKFDELKSVISELKSEGRILLPVGKIDRYDSESFEKIIRNETTTSENTKTDCNCVAFKIDNIQDFWLNDVQNKLIETFSKNKVPVTVSVLGKFFGNDPKTVNFLKQEIENSKNHISVAIRGWELVDHSEYGVEEQSSSIDETNKQLIKKLGIKSTVFSPPFGKFNDSTLNALKQNDISYITATVSTDTANFKSRPIHIPETYYLPNLLDDDPFLQGTVVEKMITKIKDQQNKFGYALINTQPSDFAVRDDEFKNEVNSDRMKLFEDLILEIKNNDMKIILLEDIPQERLFDKYPSWIKLVYMWYEQEKISDIELENAVNNLISRNIIVRH